MKKSSELLQLNDQTGGADERGNFFSREKKFPLSPAHSHFTLIELLVVIAIIAILAAILLPSLQEARERGRMAGCISNLKNMSQSLFRYAEDFEEWGPNLSGDNGYTYTVFTGTVTAGYLNPDKVQRKTHVFQYLMCPSARYQETSNSYLAGTMTTGNRLITSYANVFGCGKRDGGTKWFNWYTTSDVVSSIKETGKHRAIPSLRMLNKKIINQGLIYEAGSPAAHPMLGDADTNPSYPTRMTVYGYSSGPRHHKKGNNNVFLDGHCEFSKYGTFNNYFPHSASRAVLRWTAN